MATNRFYGKIITTAEQEESSLYGLPAAKLNTLKVSGRLSEAGAASDFDFAEDYSSTATFASYKATAQSVINSMVLEFSVSTLTGSAAQDLSLWVGGAAILTNGILWGVSSSSTGSPNLFASTAAKNLLQFASSQGADILRDKYTVDATAGDNHDSLVVTYDFAKILGTPIKLEKNQYIGVYLNDDLSGLGAFSGKVFGRLI
jgi:hypothetical protein